MKKCLMSLLVAFLFVGTASADEYQCRQTQKEMMDSCLDAAETENEAKNCPSHVQLRQRLCRERAEG